MKIELLTDRAGMNLQQHRGDVIDLPVKEAKALIDSHQAIPAKPARSVEFAIDRNAQEGRS